MQLWEEVESTKRELADGRCRLKMLKNVCASTKHDWFMTEKVRIDDRTPVGPIHRYE